MKPQTQPHDRPRLSLGAAALLQLLGMGLGMAVAAHGQAAAQVYRCGAGQYSQTPCPAGKAMAVDPAPDAAQRHEAEAVAAREGRLAERLRSERHAREQAAARQQPARIGPPAAAASAPKPHHGKLAKAKRRQQAASSSVPQEPKSRRAYGSKAKS